VLAKMCTEIFEKPKLSILSETDRPLATFGVRPNEH
jgi:hypothetical protein